MVLITAVSQQLQKNPVKGDGSVLAEIRPMTVLQRQAGKQLSSAVSQNTPNTFYSRIQTKQNKQKKHKKTKTKLKLSPGQKSFNNPQPTFPENKTDTLYYQHEYLQYSQMIQDGSFQNAKHVLFHYYCTVKMTPITQKNEHKFQAPPLWQLVCCVDTESLDYREVKHEIYSGPSSVCMKEMDRRLYMRSGHSQLQHSRVGSGVSPKCLTEHVVSFSILNCIQRKQDKILNKR